MRSFKEAFCPFITLMILEDKSPSASFLFISFTKSKFAAMNANATINPNIGNGKENENPKR